MRGSIISVASGVLLHIARFAGGSGFWREAGRFFIGLGLTMFVGSRFVRTRAKMRRKLLERARKQQGRISVVDASLHLNIPPEAARDLLENLVEIDLARRDPDREGSYLVLAH